MAKNETKEWMNLAIMGIGAGAKGTIVGIVKNFLPGLEIGDDIAGIVAGGLLYKFGARAHPLLRKLGAGVLISSIGGLAEGFIGGIGGFFKGGESSNTGSNPNPNPNTNSLAAMAEAEARRTIKTGVMIA